MYHRITLKAYVNELITEAFFPFFSKNLRD